MNSHKPICQITTELRAYFAEKGLETSASIAKATQINQSQVYRNLFCEPKRLSKTLQSLCKYADLHLGSPIAVVPDPRNCTVLMDALSEVWDGSEDHAKRLADLLFAHDRAVMGR
ncbi:hypothetical protein [Pseudomonas corrugata]|uniref:hypothetical protein n=1 Tax=Pseudomonas corrugata TaxID=47879 RepID=UPI001586B78A|nr:hypothetical protein [Pseudomonas corrugata]